MAKLRCISTCYMPTGKVGGKSVLERYEDVEDEDIYEVQDNRVDEFLTTNKFEPVE